MSYGYTGHVMDFPGTINGHFEHFMHLMLDITKSLAYHGFKKIILLNGHGSNVPNLDLVARRTNLETDAECVSTIWSNLLTVDKDFLPSLARRAPFRAAAPTPASSRRRSTSISTADNVREDKIANGDDLASTRRRARSAGSTCFATGPATVISWTSELQRDGRPGRAPSWPRRRRASARTTRP